MIIINVVIMASINVVIVFNYFKLRAGKYSSILRL